MIKSNAGEDSTTEEDHAEDNDGILSNELINPMEIMERARRTSNRRATTAYVLDEAKYVDKV